MAVRAIFRVIIIVIIVIIVDRQQQGSQRGVQEKAVLTTGAVKQG